MSFFPWEHEPPSARGLPREKAMTGQERGGGGGWGGAAVSLLLFGDLGTKTKITGGFLNCFH